MFCVLIMIAVFCFSVLTADSSTGYNHILHSKYEDIIPEQHNWLIHLFKSTAILCDNLKNSVHGRSNTVQRSISTLQANMITIVLKGFTL